MRYLTIVVLLLTSTVAAQQDTAKAHVYGWKHSLVSGLTLTQVAVSNWVQGGENALSYTISVEGKSEQDLESTLWSNSYKLAFGQTRLGSQGLRKTDDKIDLETILTLKWGVYVNPYVAATFKSQFAKGYLYDASGLETPVSKFMDPAFLTQSAGVGYQPVPEVKSRFGAALREIITSDFPGYADDPTTTGIEKTRIEGGLESVTEAEWHFDENLLIKSKLELFAPFKTIDVVIVRSDNTLAAKVNKYVTVNLNVQLIHEPKVTARTQVKETLSIGLSYAVL
jgi:hypothetical protein